MSGEILHQLDLLVGEWPHLLTENGDQPEQLIILEHWDSKHCASASEIYKFDVGFIALKVGLAGSNIVDVRNLFGSSDVTKAAFRVGTDHLAPPHRELGCWIVERNPTKDVALIKIQVTKLGLADPRGVFEYGFEHWLQLAR